VLKKRDKSRLPRKSPEAPGNLVESYTQISPFGMGAGGKRTSTKKYLRGVTQQVIRKKARRRGSRRAKAQGGRSKVSNLGKGSGRPGIGKRKEGEVQRYN